MMTNRTNDISLTYDPWAFYLVVIIFAILIVITIFGNALVFAALFRFTRLRSTSNILIGNLALSDFLLSLTVLPLSAATDATGHWIFGTHLCDIWLSVDVFYCTASIWSLVAIAFDRFTATTYPVWYRGRQTNRHVVGYVIIVWLLSGLICLPGLMGWGSRESGPEDVIILETITPPTDQTESTDTHVYNTLTGRFDCVLYTEPHYVVYSAMGSFIIPLVIMIGLYAKIFAVLRERGQMLHHNRKKQRVQLQQNQQEREQQEQRALLQLQSSKQQQDNQHMEICDATKPNQCLHCNEPCQHRAEIPVRRSLGNGRDEWPHGCSEFPDDVHAPVTLLETPSLSETSVSQACSLKPPIRTGAPESPKDTSHRTDSFQSNETSLRRGTATSDPIVPPQTTNQQQQQHMPQPLGLQQTELLVPMSSDHSSTQQWSEEVTSNAVNPHCTQKNGVNRLTQKRTSGIAGKQERADYRERRATKRMGLIICIFILSWIPFTLMYLVRGLCGEEACPDKPHLRMFVTWLGYGNSALNPVLYALFNMQFRHAFFTLLRCGNHNSGHADRKSISPKRSS